MAKPVYVPTVAEHVLPADRPTAWRALIELLGVTAEGDHCPRVLGAHTVTETVISFEAPWRLVLDVGDGPGPFHQEAIVLVPDPRGCLSMWSALVSEPTDETTAAYLDAVRAEVTPRLELLASRGDLIPVVGHLAHFLSQADPLIGR